MSDVYYARPVTVTDERMQEAIEKQAKQRALREALDTQIHSRGGDAPRSSGLTRAQQKRIELQQMQDERQQQHQTNSLPPNFAMPQQQQQQYQSNSLPPNFAFSSSISMGPQQQQQRLYEVQQQQQHFHPQGNNNVNGGPNGILSNVTSPTAVRASLQAPNFAIAEVYAQQQLRNGQDRGLHAPSQELSVPLSPRQTNASPHEPQYPKGPSAGSAYHKPLTTSDMIRSSQQPPSEWGGGGGGGENVRQILRMAQQLTDDPPPQQQQNVRQAGGHYPGNARPQLQLQQQQQVPQDGPQRSAGTPLSRGAPLKREKSRERVAESRVEILQKELQTRQNEMQRMRDKERGWEDQVKQLKMELKNARQKERDLNKIVQGPQRAETAPNTGSISKLAPIDDPRRNGGERPTAPVLRAKGGGGVGSHPLDVRQSQPQQPTRKDFNNAKVFQNETFRPITAPLEPIDDVIRSSAGHQHLPPLPDSLKMASFNTRKIAFGLQQANGGTPIPLSYEQLCEFVKSQVVTQSQADALWQLFGGGEGEEHIPKKPSPPLGMRPKDPSRRNVPSSPTYETYDELEDDEDGEHDYYDDDN